ncbi:DUF3717 domain-containing protein [Flavobacterium sp.]|uniref:DUF3717 domain-containing protein n=1 Tax=Flavobacterium sp. TaxID=239 RepID=UPI0026374A2D|nr:DUF3717 domain-containing protein [Flavobacterium sp.]
MNEVPIGHIESVLNSWSRTRKPDNHVICKQERILANIYGLMIFEKIDSIPVSRLTPDQIELLNLPNR